MTNKKAIDEIKWLLTTQNKFHWWRVVEGGLQLFLFLLMLLGFQFLMKTIDRLF